MQKSLNILTVIKIYPKLTLLTLIVLTSCFGVRDTWLHKHNETWKENVVSDDAKVVKAVYLIGDAGKPDIEGPQDPVLALLEKKLKSDTAGANNTSQKNKALVYLGDNVYEYGMPAKDANDRAEAEARLIEQLKLMKDFAGTKLIIPGNHDWNKMKKDGWEYVINQQNFVDEYLKDSTIFQPRGGCPGPVVKEMGDDAIIIAIDSEWWLFPHKRPEGASSPCASQDEADLLVQVNDIVLNHKDKHILLVMHHPLYSNGNHGGHYNLMDHIFPLTITKDNLYIPLPVIGSIYPIARKNGVTPEDIPHPKYQELKQGLIQILSQVNYSVIATGHEHCLQLHQIDEINHIVSGSGSKTNYTVKRNNAEFVAKRNGFSIVKYYDNGEAWVEFWAPVEDNEEGELLMRKPLYAIPPKVNDEVSKFEIPDYTDSTITRPINFDYKAGPLEKIIMGKGYREDWSTAVTLDYMDMVRYKGGLDPIKMGGGMQTYSLRVMGGDGNQYTMRSVDKDPVKLLPPALRGTFAEDLYQDAMSTGHPFGALAIPKLADALDVYHTDPKLFYIPYTPSLGRYLDEFGGMIALTEIRPDEDLSEFRRFGKSKNVVGTAKLVEELKEDNDNSLDTLDFLRARLLDMFVGDWDRHQDQWRWAEFDDTDGKGEIYRPVPRDRDQAFVRFDGLITSLAASKVGVRNLSNFRHEIHDVLGLMLSGSAMDHRILSGVSKDVFIETALDVKSKLTDEVIASAMQDFPPEIQRTSGIEIAEKLKARRDKLETYVEEWYEFLFTRADLFLTDKNEIVNIDRKENGDVFVKVFKRDTDLNGDEREHVMLSRLYKYDETQEINIFLGQGEDSVNIEGDVKKSILVRLVIDENETVIADNSNVNGLSNKTKVFLAKFYEDNNEITDNGELRVIKRTLEPKSEDMFGMSNYAPPSTKIVLSTEFNADFGLFLGAGFAKTKRGFGHTPYKSYFSVKGNYSLKVNAYNFYLDYIRPNFFAENQGFHLDVDFRGPGFLRNYFGKSNESTYSENNLEDFRVGLNSYDVDLMYTNQFNDNVRLKIGPSFEIASKYDNSELVDFDTLRFNEVAAVDDYMFLGVQADFDINMVDNDKMPKRGFRFLNSAEFEKGIGGTIGSPEFFTVRSAASAYLTPVRAKSLTFAFRIGGEHYIGDYVFYKAPTLGSRENLRGYRFQRFTGETSFFQNVEARLKVSSLRSYLLKADFGVLGFFDNGRVWVDGENSDMWHQGYGGGLWVNVFNLLLVRGEVGFSDEGHFFRFGGGFLF